EGFFIADEKGDTLLFASRLDAGMKSNFFAFLGNEAEIDHIGLTGARVYINREEGDAKNTLKTFLAKVSKPSGNKKQSGGIRLSIQNLLLNDVLFIKDISTNNKKNPGIIDRERQLFSVPYGHLRINSIDIDNDLIDIRSAHFDGLTVDLESYERQASKPYTPPAVRISNSTSSPPKESKPLIFRVGELLLTKGRFQMDMFDASAGRSTLPGVMDYEHLDIQQINLQGEKLVFNDRFDSNEFSLQGRITHLSAKETSGFELIHAEVEELMISDTLASLVKAKINTEGSHLGDTIQFVYSGYRDLRRFEDSVYLDIRLTQGSELKLGDLTHVDNQLAKNDFFIQNQQEVAQISGHIYGKIARLRADGLTIALGNTAKISCDFRGNNLNSREEPPMLSIDFQELRTDLSTIERIIPGFKPPEQFFKLGSVTFKGNYQLFDWVDHVLYGDLNSDLGAGRVDMQLNLEDGPKKATYSGGLKMQQFDMATWMGNSQFGRATFNVSIAENSTGLTLSTINTKINGKIDTLTFKGYSYRDIYLNGAFNEKIFDGQLRCNDPNVDFTFDGVINLKEDTPKFDFSADLRRLDLGVLNLSNQDIVLFGDIEHLSLRGKNFDEITGSALVRNIRILQDREDWHRIDSLRFSSYFRPNGSRYFGFNSDIAKCEMSGRFNLDKVIPNLIGQFSKNHQAFARQLGLKVDENQLNADDSYSLTLQIHNSKNLTKLISPNLDTLRNVYLKINVEARKGLSDLRLNMPELAFGDLVFQDPSIRMDNHQDSTWFNIWVPNTALSGSKSIPPVELSGAFFGDNLYFNLEAKERKNEENISYYLESVFLKGELSIVDTLWQVRFNSSKMKMFSQEWLIADNNFVRFNSKYFETNEFEFFNGNKRILLEDQNNGRGAVFSMTNFNLNEFNRLLDPEFLTLRGNIYDFDISIQDIFLLEGMQAGFLTDTFFLNEQPYGILTGNLDMEDLSSPLLAKIFLQKNQSNRLRLAGAWLPNSSKSLYLNDLESNVESGELFASATFDGFPLDIIETFIPEISKTAGEFDGQLTLDGSPDRVGVSGALDIRQGQVQLDYLKAMFHIKNQKVVLKPNKIEVLKDTIWDATQEHMAYVNGTLSHDNFSKWRVNCTIESADRAFTILNTTAQDNELYYGLGIGYFLCEISGSFSRTNMVVTAVTGKNSRLYIPLTSSSDAKNINFINFTNSQQEGTQEGKPNKNFSFTDLKGLNFEMNLSVTEEAEVQLIFDEQAGDIIKSWGSGDIKLNINREGDFKMYGRYEIVRGEYLFTLLNFVNKPFTLVSGGTISWYGDPYGAELNLDAKYEQSTAVYNFVRDEVELLTTIQDEAAKATKVVVTMHLKGELLKPSISFDMDFPNVTSQLKSLTDNKLRVLKQDQNELSRQVFGLVVIGSFLPPNTNFIQPNDYAASLYNTFTQMIGNQFSNYLAGLASEWFKGNVSSIDLDIIYSDYQNALNDPGQSLVTGGRELQVRLKSGFNNDRITVQVGSQFGIGSRASLPVNDGFLGEDVTIEIRLTKNNQWRLKMYQRLEPDISGQRRDRYGLGLSFQKEYDSFGAMLQSIGDGLRKKG
ncbi:MAG: translocation/assembly module TamB domain-containing protein, partial [Saprospiraceae bacterium]|nr:translocation/assembly module TamB domain-containing protein [Saprospiraceae bacterium]